jgi:SAM-dependent methyltransferase
VPDFVACADALIQSRDGRWLFSNPRSRTHVAIDESAMGAAARLGSGADAAAWRAALRDARGRDATRDFFGEVGLHADHTGMRPPSPSALSGDALFDLLCRRWLLVEKGGPRYEEYFKPLTSILDREHIGSFHQRIGQYLTVEKRLREQRWRWWQDQKFLPDGLSVREGPYKFIQEKFVTDYYSRQGLRGLKILDFGCGNGFYSRRLAELGAKVLGIDTSADLIDMAKRNHGDKAEFVRFESPNAELKWLEGFSNEFDLIFMQDILLLVLSPEDGTPPAGVERLLAALHRAVKPAGSVCMMEPDPVFWLAGRYGDPARPYAVVTEYQKPTFNVVPSLGEIVGRMSAAGFGLTEHLHPPYEGGGDEFSNERAYANEFAIWDFMRFRPYKK